MEWRSVVGWGGKKREREGERTRWNNELMKENEGRRSMVEWRSVVGWGRKKRVRDGEIGQGGRTG